jgi:hypothetical protein
VVIVYLPLLQSAQDSSLATTAVTIICMLSVERYFEFIHKGLRSVLWWMRLSGAATVVA